jgi:phage terminase large subunit
MKSSKQSSLKSNPRVHEYKPRGACKEVLYRHEPEVLISGPAGTGKSRACLEKLHFAAMRYPGMRGLIVRKTLVSLASTALETWRRYVAVEALANGDVEYYGGSSEEPPQYRYTNGSTIVIGGLDKASRIMSSEYDLVYVQEATELDEEDWEAITTRLRNWVIPFQQLIADCNPSTPFHWLKVRARVGKTILLESQHEDNPQLFDDEGNLTERGAEYIAKLDKLTGARKERLRHGKWVAAEGAIYTEWSPNIHHIEPFEIPSSWMRFWGVDFGFVNPFCLQWWAEDPDSNLHLYREIYMTHRTVDDHCETVARQVMHAPVRLKGQPWQGQWTEPRPTLVLCDHDAEGREVFERALGISTSPAFKVVSEGIQAVQERLKQNRLYIHRDTLVEVDVTLQDVHKPVCTSDEIVNYIWDTGGGKKLKEVPLKEDDHGMDTMRYVVAERDLVGSPRIRWM